MNNHTCKVHVWDLACENKVSKGFKFENIESVPSDNTFGGPRNADNKGKQQYRSIRNNYQQQIAIKARSNDKLHTKKKQSPKQ